MATLNDLPLELVLLLVEGALSRSDLDRLYRRGAPKGAPPPQRLDRTRVVGAIVGRALGRDDRGDADSPLQTALCQALDKRARTEIRLLDGMKVEQAGELLENYGGLKFAKQRARMIWAAFRHENEAVRTLGKRVSKQLLKGIERGEDTVRIQAQPQKSGTKRNLPSPDVAQLQLQVGRLRQDLEERDQRLHQMQKELQRLQAADHRAIGAQRREEAARHELDELHRQQNREGDELRATLRQRDKEFANVQEERDALRAQLNEIQTGPATTPTIDPRINQLRDERDAARRDRSQLQERLQEALRRLPQSGKGEGLVILLDLANLSAGARALGRPIDYSALVHRLCAGRKPIKVVAFTSGDPNEEGGRRFTEKLQAAGIEVRWKTLWRQVDGNVKADWDVGITLEALRWRHTADSLLLGSGDGDFVELVQQLQTEGLRVEAAGWPERSHRQLKESVDRFFPLDTQDLMPC